MAHPHYSQWWQDQLTEIRQATREHSGVDLAQFSQKEQAMNNGNIEPPAIEAGTEQPPKRTWSRKPKAPAAGAAGEGEMIALSPAQVCTLWQAVTGGTLEIKGNAGIKVSLNSFNKALPVLLDYMGANGQ